MVGKEKRVRREDVGYFSGSGSGVDRKTEQEEGFKHAKLNRLSRKHDEKHKFVGMLRFIEGKLASLTMLSEREISITWYDDVHSEEPWICLFLGDWQEERAAWMVTSNLQPITFVIGKLNTEYPRPRQSVQAQDEWKKLGWWEEYDMRVGASGRTRRSINKLIAQIQIRRLNSILVEDTTGLGVCVGPLTSL